MSLLVTGSIGIDTVETPHGRAEQVLGGSSVYFSLAASCFTDVRLIGVVGEDFDDELFAPLHGRRIDLSAVERRPGSRTFRWQGRYAGTMNEAETVAVELNVLAEAAAAVPGRFADSRFVFLANTHPEIQYEFARKFAGARLIVCDTMNLWIETQREALLKVLGAVHGMVLNEGEARLLTGKDNWVSAGRAILDMGPQFVAIKKGEYGSVLVSRDDLFVLAAYPTEKTIDPTGCGDTFAGGMLGYLAERGKWDRKSLRAAMARGTVLASFVIESFSVGTLAGVQPDDIQRRLRELRELSMHD